MRLCTKMDIDRRTFFIVFMNVKHISVVSYEGNRNFSLACMKMVIGRIILLLLVGVEL